MSRTLLLFFACLLQAALLIAAPAFAAGKRVALVIGNASYDTVGTLANPITDAKAVSEAFTTAGFDDVRLVDDLSAEAMRRELKEFSARAAAAEVAVVYYAGHGVEVADQNYLVPVDAKLLRSTDIEFEAISLASVRASVSGAAKLRLVVLDACRNNPFKLVGNNGTRAATRGLANIEPGAGEVVAYSAKEGTLAQDGPPNANSPFATALVTSLKQPGLEIRLLFGKVRDDVLAATQNEQEPYTYASLGGEAIYLSPPRAEPVVAVPEAKSFRDCPDCPDMIEIPAGRFTMGSPESERGREKDEGPQHLVTIPAPFAAGKFEITRAQYMQFVNATGHDTGNRCTLWDGTRYASTEGKAVSDPGFAQSDDHPATCLSWNDAQAYVAWLSKRAGQPYRLLSESEWEYAARAGAGNALCHGPDSECSRSELQQQRYTSRGPTPSQRFWPARYARQCLGMDARLPLKKLRRARHRRRLRTHLSRWRLGQPGPRPALRHARHQCPGQAGEHFWVKGGAGFAVRGRDPLSLLGSSPNKLGERQLQVPQLRSPNSLGELSEGLRGTLSITRKYTRPTR